MRWYRDRSPDDMDYVRGDPPKLALPLGGLLRKRYSAVRGQSGKATHGYANSAGDLMPRCSRKSRSDCWFSSCENSALGTKTVPKTVPILPNFETVPKPSRNRPKTVPKPSRDFVLCSFVVCCLSLFFCLRFAF